MTAPPERLYLNDPEYLLVLFDLHEPSGASELHKQRACWAEYSEIEALDEDHFALIIRSGGALEVAA